jgi:hypothetical protein
MRARRRAIRRGSPSSWSIEEGRGVAAELGRLAAFRNTSVVLSDPLLEVHTPKESEVPLKRFTVTANTGDLMTGLTEMTGTRPRWIVALTR